MTIARRANAAARDRGFKAAKRKSRRKAETACGGSSNDL